MLFCFIDFLGSVLLGNDLVNGLSFVLSHTLIYRQPVLGTYKPRQKAILSDEVGPLTSKVQAGGNVCLRFPQNKLGTDYSVLPLFVKLPGQPVFDTSLDQTGTKTVDRELVHKAIAMLPKKAQGDAGDRRSWQRQHWSYYHMDPVFMGLLAQCAHEQYMLYHGGLTDVDKGLYGVRLVIQGKKDRNNNFELSSPITIWLPHTYMSYFIGMLLTDGSLVANTESSMHFQITQGPTKLAFDLGLFHAAIHELVGLGKGHVVLQDRFFGFNPAKHDPDLRFQRLTHHIHAQSMACRLYDHMHPLFYIPNPNRTGPSSPNSIKIIHPSVLDWFDDLALAFAMLGDGGSDKHSERKSVIINGFEVDARNRLTLALGCFSDQEQLMLSDHISKLFGCKFHLRQRITANGKPIKLMELNAVDSVVLSKKVHLFYPSSCPWKQHYSAIKTWMDVPRYQGVSGVFAMNTLNELWMSGNLGNACWYDSPIASMNQLLANSGVQPVDWSKVLSTVPQKSRSQWHCPKYLLNSDQYYLLNCMNYTL